MLDLFKFLVETMVILVFTLVVLGLSVSLSDLL